MFDFIRTHQRLMQFLLLVLIFPSFALIGVSGYTNYVSGDEDLVKVGDSAVTKQEYEEARRTQLQRMQANSGGAFDPAVLDTPQVRTALLESLIERRVVIDEATENRFSVSDNVLRQTIASIPELQVDGQFSPERYSQVLASMGVSSKDFEQGQRGEMALQRVLGPVVMTASAPAPVIASIEKALTAERTIRLRALAASDYADDIHITDEDIKSWYDSHPQDLQVPEYVNADYILLDEQAAMQGLPAISDSDMQAYYEQNKARYVMPARVELSHILVQVPAGASPDERDAALKKAQQIAEQAKAEPGKFAELAATESQDAGTSKDGGKLGWITKGAWPADMETAAFALEQGQVSDPVQGPEGYHVFLASNTQAEQGESFEQAKSKVQSEIRRQLGSDRYAEMATKLTDLVYENPSSLQPAAEALGLTVQTVSGISSSQLLPADDVEGDAAVASPDAALLDDPRVRRALFSSETYRDKQNSGVIEISPGTMLVVRVNQIVPAHIQPLDKAADAIRQTLIAERSLKLATQAGQKVLADLKAADGKADEAALEEFGEPLTISRINPQGLNKQVLDAAFNAPATPLPAYVGVEGGQGFIIVVVEDAKAGEPNPALQASLPAEIGQIQAQAEERAVMQAMRDAVGVEVLPGAQEVLAGEDPAQG